MKSNQEIMREGVCRYCGQVRMVKAAPSMFQEDIDTAASKECNCIDAKAERRKEQQHEKARQNIEKLFHNDHEIAELLSTAVRMILDYQIDSTTVKCGKMTAKASMTSKGTIKIIRQEKNEDHLES